MMKQFEYVITDPAGLHARPAGMLVRAVKAVDSDVTIGKAGGKIVPADRVIGVMGLGVKTGDTVVVTLEGGDEDANLETLKAFFSENM